MSVYPFKCLSLAIFPYLIYIGILLDLPAHYAFYKSIVMALFQKKSDFRQGFGFRLVRHTAINAVFLANTV